MAARRRDWVGDRQGQLQPTHSHQTDKPGKPFRAASDSIRTLAAVSLVGLRIGLAHVVCQAFPTSPACFRFVPWSFVWTTAADLQMTRERRLGYLHPRTFSLRLNMATGTPNGALPATQLSNFDLTLRPGACTPCLDL